MEKQTEYEQFHIRMPEHLLNWYRRRAEIERRSTTAEMVKALEAYQQSVEISVDDTKKLLEK